MNKKLLILLIALVSVLICLSVVVASDNSHFKSIRLRRCTQTARELPRKVQSFMPNSM
ncbi:hypothetical protein [uncultured Methanobrevibacter sp.]|uniref:hypothetical protein n=1 Tax=uncultured Methanobrevibacter sp. TaxID=253161 RepID=UPI0025CF4E38|nr:hypothetical protein [uncultured Methanobrevibacter sp.]